MSYAAGFKVLADSASDSEDSDTCVTPGRQIVPSKSAPFHEGKAVHNERVDPEISSEGGTSAYESADDESVCDDALVNVAEPNDGDFLGECKNIEDWRNEQGVTVSNLCGDGHVPSDVGRPVLLIDGLANFGVSEALLSKCRSCARGASKSTPIQAEIWGLLFRPAASGVAAVPVEVAVPEVAAVPVEVAAVPVGVAAVPVEIAVPAASDLRPEDVPIPESSDDEELASDCHLDVVQALTSSSHANVREDFDIVGIAPTGSGKTMAFIVPLVADGLCASRRPAPTSAGLFSRVSELFSSSFPAAQGTNAALLPRIQGMFESGDFSNAIPVLAKVAERAARGDAIVPPEWRRFLDDCGSVGLVRPSALVLSPTRELAQQVADVGIALGAACTAVVGGVDHQQQREDLAKEQPALLVATPGRLLALCGQWPSSARARQEERVLTEPEPAVTLRFVARLVLDEADRLLDEGFEEDIRSIETLASWRRQTLLFSATWNSKTEGLATSLRPGTVHVTVSGVPPSLEQRVELMPKVARGRRLREILRDLPRRSKVLVFVLFKKEAKDLAKMLISEGVLAWPLEGGMSQAARFSSMSSFRNAVGDACSVLVATDVAARGLDVPDVTHVINFSFGLSPESYVHRIGRCGRAGRKGKAHTFVTDGDERFAAFLLGVLQQARQPVPNGLTAMATLFERTGGNAKLAVQWDKAGEVRIVTKGGLNPPGAKSDGDESDSDSQDDEWGTRRKHAPRGFRAPGRGSQRGPHRGGAGEAYGASKGGVGRGRRKR